MESSEHIWRACFDELAPKLVLFARQWVGSMAEAEDVVQLAFVKFWRHRPGASREHYPLLYAVVRTCALDAVRGHGRRVRREADPRASVLREDEPYFDRSIEERERAEAIEDALGALPEAQREVLVLKIWGELTFAEIATALGESNNTVASRYRYAVEALRRIMKASEYERV